LLPLKALSPALLSNLNKDILLTLQAVTIIEQPFVSAYKVDRTVDCNNTEDQQAKLCPKPGNAGGKAKSIYFHYTV